MRVMVLVKATKDSETGIKPEEQGMFEAMGKYNEELVNAGMMQAGEGCTSSKGKRVTFDGTSRTVIDGPFGQTGDSSPASGSGRSRTWRRRWRG